MGPALCVVTSPRWGATCRLVEATSARQGHALVLSWQRRQPLGSTPARARAGRGLLIDSYQDYSSSTGFPTEKGLHMDARTAYDWISQSYQTSRLIAYGESLGTGVAVGLASERPVAGLILDAPYTSTADVASPIYWYVPIRWLMLDQFCSLNIIGRVKAPILILHGTADRVVPFALGEQLYQAAPEPKRFVRLEGAGHSRNPEQGGMEAVNEFIIALDHPASEPTTSSDISASRRP